MAVMRTTKSLKNLSMIKKNKKNIFGEKVISIKE